MILYILWYLSFVGVGFTLLNYSMDGQNKNSHFLNRYATDSTTSLESIERLQVLSRDYIQDVSWNTSLFVALASSFGFFCLYPFMEKHKILSWFLAVFLVFGLQDLIIRWKNSHRKNKIFLETVSILEKLKISVLLQQK